MRRLSVTALALLVCLAALAAPLAAADGAYDLTSDSAVDVPDRQVEVQGDTFTISSVTRADPGDTISVTVTAPSGAETTTLLYDNEQQIVDAADSTGTSTVEFDLSGYDAGTFSLVLQDDGAREAAHPVVVRGYSVTSDAPTSVGPDDTFSVTADVSKLRGDDLTRVEVVVANDATTLRADATAANGDTYEASVDASRLGTGSYQVYATVRGPEQALGNDELLGLDDPSTLEVEEQSSGGGGGGGGVSTATDTDTPTPDGTATDTDTPTPTGPQPDERVTAEIVDERSGEPGVTVAVETQTLSTITFADESVQLAGDVTVERGPAAAAPFDDQFGADAVLTAVDVSVPPAAAGSGATLRFTVDAAALGDRGLATVGVVREVDGGVELLPTDAERSGSTVTVTAQTPGFSRFAVVSLDRLAPGTPDATDAPSATPTPTADGAVTPVDSPAPTTSGDGDSDVFVLLGLLGTAAVLAARLSGR
ncbi:MAG: hypothetical protein A07HB70_02012 [uncultured archaeon A07HB70]|nr:MAG: hypothetical protein A07HB70_02012 [uncultured archaeon A07HB70]